MFAQGLTVSSTNNCDVRFVMLRQCSVSVGAIFFFLDVPVCFLRHSGLQCYKTNGQLKPGRPEVILVQLSAAEML